VRDGFSSTHGIEVGSLRSVILKCLEAVNLYAISGTDYTEVEELNGLMKTTE
jgi:hypothetical protein